MNAKSFMKKYPSELEAVCEKAKTSVGYFQQIAYGNRFPSRALALALEKASDERMTAEELMFPEKHEQGAELCEQVQSEPETTTGAAA